MKVSPLSNFAVKKTERYLRQFQKHLRHTAKHLQDPEAIHHLRVSIRRLTQSFRTFRGLLEPSSVKKLQRRLRKVMNRCGAVRNCDVALDLLQQCGIATGASVSKMTKARRDSVKQLRRHLKKERRKKHLAPGPWRDVAAGNWHITETCAENLSRVLPAMAQEFFEDGAKAAAAGATPPDLHRFRLSSKRFRYTLESFEEFYQPEIARGIADLKGVQDRLGAINDCAVTLGLLRRNRRAVAALSKLLDSRGMNFRDYWERQFVSQKLAWWKRWLRNPSFRPAAG